MKNLCFSSIIKEQSIIKENMIDEKLSMKLR